MTEDAQCLARFARIGDESAFRELVARHLNLVYATALRRLNGDAALAEDATQIVFTSLARKVASLSSQVVLAGWRVREQKALAMHDSSSESAPDWDSIRPLLDIALDQLKAADRDAVLLHYFEKQGSGGQPLHWPLFIRPKQ